MKTICFHNKRASGWVTVLNGSAVAYYFESVVDVSEETILRFLSIITGSSNFSNAIDVWN